MAATSGQEQGEVRQEQGDMGQEMGEVGQEMGSGCGHSESGGTYSRALVSLSLLKGSSHQKSQNATSFHNCWYFCSNMMSLRSVLG